MATYNKINAFVEHLAEKVHNLGSDTLTIALTTTANKPNNTDPDTVLTDISQITYTNLSSRALTISSSSQTSGTYKLVLADLVLTASGGSSNAFGVPVLYNDTPTSPADPLIAWWEYGSDVTLASGETFTLDFDASAGVLTIA